MTNATKNGNNNSQRLARQVHRRRARQVAASVLPVAKEQKDTKRGKRNDPGKTWMEVRAKAARREAGKMTALEKWRQTKAKPAKREALMIGCSPPGAEGCDMRFTAHCVLLFFSCEYGLRPETHRYAVYMSGFLFHSTLLRLHGRAPPSSRCFAAGKRRHVQMMQTEKENSCCEKNKK